MPKLGRKEMGRWFSNGDGEPFAAQRPHLHLDKFLRGRVTEEAGADDLIKGKLGCTRPGLSTRSGLQCQGLKMEVDPSGYILHHRGLWEAALNWAQSMNQSITHVRDSVHQSPPEDGRD